VSEIAKFATNWPQILSNGGGVRAKVASSARPAIAFAARQRLNAVSLGEMARCNAPIHSFMWAITSHVSVGAERMASPVSRQKPGLPAS
jgi:hypothetical protein